LGRGLDELKVDKTHIIATFAERIFFIFTLDCICQEDKWPFASQNALMDKLEAWTGGW
jgi:hypothetical protein